MLVLNFIGSYQPVQRIPTDEIRICGQHQPSTVTESYVTELTKKDG